MSTEPPLLGRVVFGTARGLFARGNGCLSGIGGAPEALELRSGDGRRVAPEPERPVLFRRPLRLSTGDFVDLIAVANGASDLERRPGFIAYGVAVSYGDGEEFRAAAEVLTREFGPAQAHYVAGSAFRDGAGAYALPGETDRAYANASYVDPGRQSPILRLTLPSWWSGENQALAIDALDVAVTWCGKQAATIVISPDPQEGALPVGADLLDRMAQETGERREAEHRQATQELEALGILHGREDAVARRRIQQLEERLRDIERRAGVIERDLRSTRMHSAHPTRAILPSLADLSVEEEAEAARRRDRLRLAGLAAGVFVLLAIGGLVFWLLSGSEPDGMAGEVVPGTPAQSKADHILGTSSAGSHLELVRTPQAGEGGAAGGASGKPAATAKNAPASSE